MTTPTPSLSALSLHDALPISFDVSLLEVGKDEDDFSTIQVRATSGDNRLGGDDWDQRIVDWLVGEVKNGYEPVDRKSTRLNSSHVAISYAVFCLKKKKRGQIH